MSLCMAGGNARYISVDSNKIVRVPDSIEPVLATCLAETYLTAFQTLHHGQGNSNRYKKSSLKGKSILVLGSMTSRLGLAMVELATAAGVQNLFATAKSKQFQQLETLGVMPLNKDSIEWWGKLHARLDLIISLEQSVGSPYSKLLKANGEVIVVNQKTKLELDQRSTKMVFCSRRKAQFSSKVQGYDVYQQWEENLDRCKRDLSHLLTLLESEQILPNVLDRIPLTKVGKVQEFIANKRLSGFVVCEPWLVKKTRAIQL